MKELTSVIVIVKFKSVLITDDIKGKYASTWRVSSILSLCTAYNDPCVKFQQLPRKTQRIDLVK